MINPNDLRIRNRDRCQEFQCGGELYYKGVVEEKPQSYTVEAVCKKCGKQHLYCRKIEIRQRSVT